MKNPETLKTLNCVSHRISLINLLAWSFILSCGVQAYEDPPGCSLNNGGNGASYQSGIDFRLAQAHVGDTVEVVPMFGMDNGACRAMHVTGSVYVATGKLTNFLDDATLDPGIRIYEPYNILITPALVGAGVSSPHGSSGGLPKAVRATENVEGTVLSGTTLETIADGFHTASISIVTPAIQVFQQCAYPPGQTCFPADQNVELTGYVTNGGDITLTNVVASDPRSGSLQLFNPADGQPLPANVILPPGAYALFSNRFVPSPEEIGSGSAASVVTATAQDTTEIGGPNSFVTHSTTTMCSVCTSAPSGPPRLAEPGCTVNHQFQFKVVGQSGVKYVIEATTNPNSANWLPLYTNTAPFTFTDGNMALYPTRVYRAVVAP